MEIIWSRSAKETLATVLDYIEEYFDSTVAMKVYNKINNHVDLLVSFPRMGVRDPRFSIDEMEVRYLVNTPNIIYYAIIQDVIVIISVFDARCSPDTISTMYNPQIQISAESETKRSIFREKDKTKRSKKESAQHSKSRNKSFVMTSVSAL